jgi:hypothetical protein
MPKGGKGPETMEEYLLKRPFRKFLWPSLAAMLIVFRIPDIMYVILKAMAKGHTFNRPLWIATTYAQAICVLLWCLLFLAFALHTTRKWDKIGLFILSAGYLLLLAQLIGPLFNPNEYLLLRTYYLFIPSLLIAGAFVFLALGKNLSAEMRVGAAGAALLMLYLLFCSRFGYIVDTWKVKTAIEMSAYRLHAWNLLIAHLLYSGCAALYLWMLFRSKTTQLPAPAAAAEPPAA